MAHFLRLAPSACAVTVQQTANNAGTRIGELHVADASNVTGTYSYTGHADSITIGSDAGGSWATSGNSAVLNNGTGGNVSSVGATTEFITADYHYGLRLHSGPPPCPTYYTQHATAWQGDVFPGGPAPINPWGKCASDPHGRQAVPTGSIFTVSGGDSVNYTSGVAHPFGTYSFGDQTGYSANVKLTWQNNSGPTGKLTGVIHNNN